MLCINGPGTIAIRNTNSVRGGPGLEKSRAGAVAPGLLVNRPLCDVIHGREQVEFPVTALVDSMNVAVPASEHVDFVQNIEGGSLRTCIQLPETPRCMSTQRIVTLQVDNARSAEKFFMMRENL